MRIKLVFGGNPESAAPPSKVSAPILIPTLAPRTGAGPSSSRTRCEIPGMAPSVGHGVEKAFALTLVYTSSAARHRPRWPCCRCTGASWLATPSKSSPGPRKTFLEESAGVDVLLAVDASRLAIERAGGYRSPQVHHPFTAVGFAIRPNLVRSSNPPGVPGAVSLPPLRTWCIATPKTSTRSTRRRGKTASPLPKSSSSFDIRHLRQCILRTDPKNGAAHARVEPKKQCIAVYGTAHARVERGERADVRAAAADSASKVVPASERDIARATR